MKNYVFITSWIGLGAYLLYTATRGLSLPDEGYILHAASRIMNGQILYKDFDFVYTPLTPLLDCLAFILFGKSIFGERMLSLAVAMITAFFIYRLSGYFSKKTWQRMLLVLLYASWGPAHINFINPGMIAVSTAIIASYAWMRGVKEKSTLLLGITGVFILIAFLAKQNFGGALFASSLAALLLQKEVDKKLVALQLLAGLSIASAIFGFILLATGALSPFIQNIMTYTFEMFVSEGTLNTPIDLGRGIAMPFKIFIYLSPLLISLFCVWRYRSKVSVFLPLTVATYYLLGIRPETDYIHLAPLLAISALAFMPLLQAKGLVRKITLVIMVLLTISGFYTSLNFPYYRWKPQLITQNTFIPDERVMIWSDKETAREIQILKEFKTKNIKDDEKIYLNYYAPMFYFLLDKPNPTRFDFPGLPESLEAELLYSLERQKVTYVLTHPLNQLKTGSTRTYLEKNYMLREKVYGYEVWKRI
ncbi:MAG: glycosyltransferase family 39 protein [Candidatus Levybacteria bacterium]|nr:glycosyltransferase family 39 protein [Candidatus Levybacteria bacterium]